MVPSIINANLKSVLFYQNINPSCIFLYSIAHCKSKDCETDEPIKELFGDIKKKADEVYQILIQF